MTGDTQAYRPFKPRRGRAMAWAACIGTIIVFAVISFLVIPTGGPTGWDVRNQVALFVLGLAIAALLSRWALVSAVPTSAGLRVRNLFTNRLVAWDEIVGVQFGGGRPWCLIELDDTEQLAVMAIQRADGPSAEAEASRLAALVQVNSAAVPNN